MTPPKQNSQGPTIAKLSDLYVTTRKKYLVQTQDSYITLDRSNNSGIWTLNDSMLKRHIEGSNTYGVFNANAYNKFVTFDVDYSDDQPMARWATLKLIDVLQREFHIAGADIHVSISGGKGYHVDLFFDRTLPSEIVRTFYMNVIQEADLPAEKVEFRPTWTQGVKIPLGIHQRTGNRCWFVDRQTLEPIESYDYLYDVQPLAAELIEDGAIELTDEQEAEFREVVERTDTTVNVVDTSKALTKAAEILKAGRLIASNTRHSTTLTLASFFNSQGVEADVAIENIMRVLHDTPREYFSPKSTPEHWQKETERIVAIAYDRNYTLGNADRPITIYKSEILAVLEVGTFRQKQLAYAMLSTSKRYGNVFYLTMNSAMRMIGTKSKPTVNSAIKKLVERGFIEYVRKGEVDKARSAELGQTRYKPNKYRLLLDKPAEGEKSVEVTSEQSVVDVAYLLCDTDEIKERIKRYERENHWSIA
ncbi:TOTE conflict system archaeo-eukaryotic primase domain-containing protein [Sporosarcina sp. SAFN-010]|uniref:TOTE conflict system archaeo-eukaryotic primase domain-containing protein n=1 Tax=Sporosarcina sp. SAFN-010 TaxID=3387273 RepID=UPI003F81F9B5